eukprot:scaffold16715_cov80-Cyclotella_meneghiniana.AAC.1
MEITSALLEFDGIDVLNLGKVKIKRPNDYNLACGGGSLANMPRFDTSKIGIVSQTVQDGYHTTINRCFKYSIRINIQ